MKKNNDKGVGAVGVLLGLTFYIFMMSFILAFLIIQIYGVDDVKGIVLPTVKNSYSSEQNYQNGSYDPTLNTMNLFSEWEYIKGVGLILTGFEAGKTEGHVIIKYVQPDTNGDYINTYAINNSVHSNYCIDLRNLGRGIHIGSDNELCVNNEGLYIPDYIPFTAFRWGKHAFYSYPDANLIDDIIIKTVYNDEKHIATISLNDIEVLTSDNLHTDLTLIGSIYYGGVSSDTIGFVLKEFNTDNSITAPNEANMLSSLGQLLATMFAISIWSIPTWILPTEFIVLFITLPEAGLFITALIVLIRGVD
jgi:hypothetical protein